MRKAIQLSFIMAMGLFVSFCSSEDTPSNDGGNKPVDPSGTKTFTAEDAKLSAIATAKDDAGNDIISPANGLSATGDKAAWDAGFTAEATASGATLDAATLSYTLTLGASEGDLKALGLDSTKVNTVHVKAVRGKATDDVDLELAAGTYNLVIEPTKFINTMKEITGQLVSKDVTIVYTITYNVTAPIKADDGKSDAKDAIINGLAPFNTDYTTPK